MTESMKTYLVDGEWISENDGHVYRVRGLDVATKRIIGKVQVQVDIDAQADLEHYMGSAGMVAVENSARNVLRNVIEHRYDGAYTPNE